MPVRRGNVESLPKWARAEIERLERDLAAARAKLAAGPESNTFADPYSASPRPLGTDTAIEFRFGDKWSEKVQARIEGDSLRVMGGGRIAVLPTAGNVVEIRRVVD